jgi:hypothetical protein
MIEISMAETTPEKAPRKPAGRSKITNGSLGDMDGRGKWARRLADLIEGYSQEITDDPASLPMSTRVIVRRIATLTLVLEREDEAFAKADKAEPKAFDAYQTVTNSLRRLLADLQITVGSTERLQRAPAVRMIENGRLIRKVQEGFSTADWRCAYGDMIPVNTPRETARLIAYALATAEKDGTPLDPQLADFAETVGYAVVNPADDDKVVDLNEYRN